MVHIIQNRLLNLALLAAAFPALLGSFAWGAAVEDKLPASAPLVILLDQPDQAAAKWRKTALGEMLAGTDWQPLYDELQKGEIAAPLNMRPALGLDWEDIALFKEPVGLALVADEAKRPALVFLAGGKTDAAQVKQILIEAEKYFDGRQAKRTVEKAPGGELVIYEIAAAGERDVTVCVHVTKGELFAATSSRAAAEQLLKLWEAGDKTSLIRDADFNKVDAQSRKLAGEKPVDIRWFVRPLALAELLQPKGDPQERGTKDWVAIAKRQGVGAVAAIGGVTTLQPDAAHDFETASLIIAKRPFEKGMQIADLKAGKGVEPPAWVEADVGSFISWNWNFAAALKGAGKWANEYTGDPGFFDDYLFNMRNEHQVDIEKDVLTRLGPAIFEIGDSHRAPDKSNPNGMRVLIGIQSREQEKLAKKIPLLTREDDTIKQETVGGSLLRSAPEGEPLFMEADGPKNTKLMQAVAVTPTHVLVSSDATWLRSKLAGMAKSKPLVDDPAYKQLAGWSVRQENERTCLRGFMRNDESWRSDYDTVRAASVVTKSPWRTRLLNVALLGASPAGAKGPSAALPKYEALAPHLMPTGLSMAVSPDGYELRAAVLRKDSGGRKAESGKQ